MRGFRVSLMAGFVGAVLDDAVGGLGGGLTGLCSVLGILRGAGVVTAGFGWLTVVKPLVAKPLFALPDLTVTGLAVALVAASRSWSSLRFFAAGSSGASRLTCGRNSWEKMQ